MGGSAKAAHSVLKILFPEQMILDAISVSEIYDHHATEHVIPISTMRSVLIFLVCLSWSSAAETGDVWRPIRLTELRGENSFNFFEVKSGEAAVGLPFLKRIELGGGTAMLTVRNDQEKGASLAPEIEIMILNRYGMRLYRGRVSFAAEPISPGGVGAKTIRIAMPQLEEIFAQSQVKLPVDWKEPRFVGVRKLEVGIGGTIASRVERAGPSLARQQQVRPAILAENKVGTSNVGVVAHTALMTTYGTYLQRIIETVQIQWERLIIEQRAYPPVGSTVTVKFVLDSEGKIIRIVNVETSATQTASNACVSAITDRSPYGPWDEGMKTILGEQQELVFTFHYQ